MNSYNIARITKDKNFDGQFYFAVKTTGIFCRPSCPCPIAKEENVVYFKTINEAIEQGFRPCKRCHPEVFMEHFQKNIEGALLVKKALKLIQEGYMLEHNLNELAESLHVSLRHLRSLFVETIGTTPIKVSMLQRALYSQSLILNSDLKLTQIALESGFGTSRQFNDVFKKTFKVTPSDYKKEPERYELGHIILELPYDNTFEFSKVLEFLPHRITRGVEVIEENCYKRTFRLDGHDGYLSVSDTSNALKIDVYTKTIEVLYDLYQKMIGLFDLKTDFEPILKRFESDEILSKGIHNHQMPRLPVAFNPFELTIRAIINQQISIKATSTFMQRLVKKSNLLTSDSFPSGLDYFFPTPDELESTPIDEIGLTKTRQQTLKNVVSALISEEVSLSVFQSFDEFRNSFIKVKGIGNWTINYVALRGLGMVDSFPAKDLGVIKVLKTKKEKELIQIAEKWRPYRGYATLCLWHIKE